jgi:peptidase E
VPGGGGGSSGGSRGSGVSSAPVNGSIVAIGGRKFWQQPVVDPRFDAFILGLAGRPRPRVCFLPTAGGDAESCLYRFYRAMSLLCGISAGTSCWFESSTTDSCGLTLQPLADGLGILGGSACPRHDSEPQRHPLYQRLADTGELPAGWAADNDPALHFSGGELVEAVATREGATGHRVEPGPETAFSARLLR